MAVAQVDFTDSALPKHTARFWSKVCVASPDECWIWQGGTSKGYGQFFIGRVKWRAHRFAWSIAHRQPIKNHILHSCDNPPCCNPNHLRDGTPLENIQDCVKRGRRVVVFRSKLELVEVRTIRRALSAGIARKELAQQFGVNTSTIGQIWRNEIWKWT